MAVSNVYNAHWCYHQSTLTEADFRLGGKVSNLDLVSIKRL